MMRVIWKNALFGLFVWAALSAFQTAYASGGAMLYGSLLGADGKPLKMARVQLQRRLFPLHHRVVIPNAKGEWRLRPQSKGLFWLILSGIGHKRHKLLLSLPLKGPLRLQVRLGRLRRLAKPKRIRLRLVIKEPVEVRWFQRMKLLSKGEYVATVPKSSMKTWVQISGAAKGIRLPTTKGNLVYDRVSGRYMSLFLPHQTPAKIRFRLSSLSQRASKQTVISTPPEGLALHQLYQLFQQEQKRAYSGYKAFFKERKKKRRGYIRYEHDYRSLMRRLERLKKRYPEIRLTADAMVLAMPFQKANKAFQQERQKKARALLQNVPPHSPIWSLRWSFFDILLRQAGYRARERHQGEGKQLVDAFLKGHPNPGIKMNYLGNVVSWGVFCQRYFGAKYKKYRAYVAKRERPLARAMKAILAKARGQKLDPTLEQKLLRALLMEAHMQPPRGKKRHPPFMSRGYTRYYQLLEKDPKFFWNQAHSAFRKLARLFAKYPKSRRGWQVKRARWSLFPSLKKGKLISAFQMPLLDQAGKVFRQQDLKGRYTLLSFWATWCPPCIQKMPMLHKIHKAFRGKGLRMVSISINRDVQDVREFRHKKWSMPWDNVVLPVASRQKILGLFEVSGVPRMVLIGPKGTLLAAGAALRNTKLMLMLKRFLKGPRAQATHKKGPLPKPSSRPANK